VLSGPDERLFLAARRHSAAVVRPLAFALVLGALGVECFRLSWPLPVVGAACLAVAAVVALRRVWRWDRTQVVVTTEKLCVVEGTLRRRAETVPLRSLESLRLRQSLAGRLLGYGTLVAGPLEVRYVPDARRVFSLVERLSA
jgi:uncharacterized membrane protein YdbT with pleckstrin-like domain